MPELLKARTYTLYISSMYGSDGDDIPETEYWGTTSQKLE